MDGYALPYHLFSGIIPSSHRHYSCSCVYTAIFLSQTGTAWSVRRISLLYKLALLLYVSLTLTYLILPWIYLGQTSLVLDLSKLLSYFWVDTPLKPWTSDVHPDTQIPFGKPSGWIFDSVESMFDLTQAKRNTTQEAMWVGDDGNPNSLTLIF